MRKYVPGLVVAGLLLCGALIAGCASSPTTNATTAPTSSATTVQTTAGGAAGQATATVIPMTTTAPTTVPPTTATTATTAAGGAASVDLTAQNLAFDKSTITVPAGATVTVHFNNMDSGVPHTFSVYSDSSASTTIFKGQRITGPSTTTYTFTAPSTPGTYFFRCDVHPTQMTGQFIVR